MCRFFPVLIPLRVRSKSLAPNRSSPHPKTSPTLSGCSDVSHHSGLTRTGPHPTPIPVLDVCRPDVVAWSKSPFPRSGNS